MDERSFVALVPIELEDFTTAAVLLQSSEAGLALTVPAKYWIACDPASLRRIG